MKNQVAKAWQVWIYVVPLHSKSVSRLTRLTNLIWKPNPTNKGIDRQPRLCLTLCSQKSPVRSTLTLIIEALLYRVNTGLNNCRFNFVCVNLIVFPFAPLPLLALFRLTVEILCSSAKALHLPVITNHPSLPRLFRVEPPVPPVPLCFTLSLHPSADMWSLCWVHPELYTWSRWLQSVCEQCCCCDVCRLFLTAPWAAQAAGTLPNNATFTRALTLPCLLERTGRPCLNRMHLVCLPAQGQGQSATWLLCQAGLTYGPACHSYNKRSAVALCVQQQGHILSEYLQ